MAARTSLYPTALPGARRSAFQPKAASITTVDPPVRLGQVGGLRVGQVGGLRVGDLGGVRVGRVR